MAEDDKYFLRKKANRLEEENARLKKRNEELDGWYKEAVGHLSNIRHLLCDVNGDICGVNKKCPECLIDKIFKMKTRLETLETESKVDRSARVMLEDEIKRLRTNLSISDNTIGLLNAEVKLLNERQLPDGVEWPTDADGQRIEVGDHLKSATGIDKKATVVGFAFKPLYKFDGDEYEFMLHECNLWHHYEPDSWEKLEEDAGLSKCKYNGQSDIPLCDVCDAYVGEDGLFICIGSEKKCHDLVRRAKALAGVE